MSYEKWRCRVSRPFPCPKSWTLGTRPSSELEDHFDIDHDWDRLAVSHCRLESISARSIECILVKAGVKALCDSRVLRHTLPIDDQRNQTGSSDPSPPRLIGVRCFGDVSGMGALRAPPTWSNRESAPFALVLDSGPGVSTASSGTSDEATSSCAGAALSFRA